MTKIYDNNTHHTYSDNVNRKQQQRLVNETKKNRSLLFSSTSSTVITTRCSSSDYNNNMTTLCSSQQQDQHKQSNQIQVMERVLERLDDFMIIPFTSCQFVDSYRIGQGFPSHTIHASDRDAIFHLLYQYRKQNITLFMALEDGSSYYYSDSWTSLRYREPGNSGYIVNDDTMNETNPYYKNYISCIDSNNGTPKNCTMIEGMYYIECINDCEFITCPNPPNATTGTITSQHLCQNYQVKYVVANETSTLGYIPTSFYCVDNMGQPEQRPGYVLTNVMTQSLGNCYYSDGITMVNRTLSGVYASCQSPPTTNDPNDDHHQPIICYNTFTGAFGSDPYDARARSWYISSKLYQTTRWTDPYPFFVPTKEMDISIGITYTYPMFSSSIDHHNNQSTFVGVIGVDYKLDYMNEFLQEKFPVVDDDNDRNHNDKNNNDMMFIMIIETSFPNYIIASNGGGPFTKLMLQSNLTLPCPWNETNKEINCQIQRIPIMELPMNRSSLSFVVPSDQLYNTKNNKILQNHIYQKAFVVQQENHFPIDTRIPFQVSNHPMDSPAYVVMGQYYQQPTNNLLWHVFVIINMHRSTDDAVVKGSVSFTVTCLLGTIGVLSCFILFILFYQHRRERAIRQSDYIFTCAFIFGCSILNMSSFTFLGENTNVTCMLRMWSFNFLFVAALSPLFVKVWRMHELLQASGSWRKKRITNIMAFFYTLPLVLIETLILLIFSIADPPMPKQELGVGNDNGGIGVQQITCSQTSSAFSITQLVFNDGLVFIGCILAYQTRNLDPKFGESKQLCFAMYNIAVTGLLVLCTIGLVDLSRQNQVILQSLGILWASFFSSIAFVLPRLIQVQDDTRTFLTSDRSVRISGLTQSSGSPKDVRGKAISGLELFQPFPNLDNSELANNSQGGSISKSIIEGIDASLKGINTELVDLNYDGTDNDISMTLPISDTVVTSHDSKYNEANIEYPHGETTSNPTSRIEGIEASFNDVRGVFVTGNYEETSMIRHEDGDGNIITLPVSETVNTTHDDDKHEKTEFYPGDEMKSKLASIIEGIDASLKGVNDILPIADTKLPTEIRRR